MKECQENAKPLTGASHVYIVVTKNVVDKFIIFKFGDRIRNSSILKMKSLSDTKRGRLGPFERGWYKVC